MVLGGVLAIGLATSVGGPSRAQGELTVKVASGYSLSTIATDLHVRAPSCRPTRTPRLSWSWAVGTEKHRIVGQAHAVRRSIETQRVLTKLDRPVGLVMGPDKKLYLGEVTRIGPLSTRPRRPFGSNRVITDLPGKGLHPLTTMAFSNDASPFLVVNVGSSTNNCEASKKYGTCAVASGTNWLASLRRYDFDWSTGKAKKFR